MKYILLLIIIIELFFCPGKLSAQRLLPKEFQTTPALVGSGMEMVYVNRNTGDTNYTKLYLIKSLKNDVIIQCSYSANMLSDSILIKDGRVIEYYLDPYYNGDLWKANQLTDTLIRDAAQFVEESKYSWQKKEDFVNVTARIRIIKDTVMQWNNKPRKTLVIQTTLETSSNFLRTPEGNYNSKMEIISYLGKGVGVMKRVILCNWCKGPIVNELVAIRHEKR